MMDALRPGHAHRSSSDRLLSNYLDAQKSLSNSLLNLLSHSHTSTSSLLAYVTSSPGVLPPVRRSVRHAGFEGPLSGALLENADGGSHAGSVHGGDVETQGWAAYIASLDQFRKDLKQIHLLEEELSRVKRDREILVTRLIKTTKSRPSKNDLSAIANSYSRPDGSAASSRASTYSFTSNGSTASKEGKRAGKLAEAQAELLGCEEHLRGLEVRIEQERNKVMMKGLEERFRSMEAVGRMWVSQAKRGLDDLEKVHELPADAYELDSNPSIAPSQSASQNGYEDHHASPRRNFGRRQPAGSITGSIAEEDETGSSGDEVPASKLVVHENRPNGKIPRSNVSRSTIPAKPSPLGVPSVNQRTRPLSSTFHGGGHDNGSDDDDFHPGGRRAASDVGAMTYHPPGKRQPLRRTFSDNRHNASPPPIVRRNSDTSSIGRGPTKKKGFFASIGRLFKAQKRRDGRESPPYGASNKGGWNTRTETNLKRQSSLFPSGRRGGDDSSSDEEQGNFVSVANNRNSTWSVDNVGRQTGSTKRSSTLPVASGLIPAKPTRADLGANRRNSSQSTITKRAATPSGTKTPTARSQTPADVRPNTPATALSRSNTVKSIASVKSTGTVKSAGTTKTTGTAKKTRPNGSISRAAAANQQAAEGRTIMSLVDPPAMPEVPKAPKSQVSPQMELAKAPGSSLVTAQAAPKLDAKPTMARSNSERRVDEIPRAASPLPPSRTLSPPLKSALRPSSPSPTQSPSMPVLSPPIETKPMFTATAPGPVKLPPAPKPEPTPAPVAVSPPKPAPTKRDSYRSMTTDGGSVYESAVEDDGPGGDSGSETEDDIAHYKVVDNTRIARLGEIARGVSTERVPRDDESVASDDTAQVAVPAAAPAPISSAKSDAGSVNRRKSVRITAPDSPVDSISVHAPPPLTSEHAPDVAELERSGSPEPERGTDGQWATRIGRMREDTSDESDNDAGYTKARKGLLRNSGQWEAVDEKPRKKTTGGSVRSKSSRKSAK
ncbi:hypothetical protein BCR39DRAFT_526039 [Naematelia encephala]|uniref:Uncharacterized protein n=1 Tax=Naematelia encephala TaxID=71784 RepID=A0A1Y2BAT1_9TREE|nr:hypothetical protein BCR39DRAFT_526039 [Naematelia encephala]